MLESDRDLIESAAAVVSAYVSNNSVTAAELPGLIGRVYDALSALGKEPDALPVKLLVPAVSIKKSITPDYLVCLEDGLQFKSLKRHLQTRYDLSPEQYRAKWSLPSDYPMVAPAYAERRSALAKAMGLGRKAGSSVRKRR
ncbi:MucR family transcriptional regulator [Bosea sp. Leaf344]|uniref:MucR family transcriptional regulator n=1 Tax=Bosea sp. Leaf344 TaxID=1736346 RepID=UPI0009EB65F5|nr:MucR family transcriptional regulator [Bosea sp. Leaf344]